MQNIDDFSESTQQAALSRTVFDSDRTYFELGAQKRPVPGADLVWVPGFTNDPASVVAQRVDPAMVASAGVEWVFQIERQIEDLGAPMARFYVDGAISGADNVFESAGYRSRQEIAFLGNPNATGVSDYQFRQVVTDADWARKMQFHRHALERPDGHTSPGDDWAALERVRCQSGLMQSYLCEFEGEPVGTIGVVPGADYLRAKNLITHPDYRFRGVATEMLNFVGNLARQQGKAGICILAIAGGPGEKVYAAAGLKPVGTQVEWAKELRASNQSRAGALGDDEALRTYPQSGYARISGLFTATEVDSLRAEADRLCANPSLFDDPARNMVRLGDDRADRIDPVIDVSPRFAKLAMDRRLLDIAGKVLGSEAQLLKDKFIAKPPGATGYGVHQDVAYWHELGIAGEDAVTLALCLDPCTRMNGALEFAPGYHHALLTDPGVVADPDESSFPHFDLMATDPGDLLVFSALAPHRSGNNNSADQRRVLFLTFVRDEREDMYQFYQHKRSAF